MTIPSKRILIFIIFAIVLLLGVSCAKESVIEKPRVTEPSIKEGSTLAGLMRRTSMYDGSIDNIIDNASCFGVVLPVSLFVNNELVTVETVADYQNVEEIFDRDDFDENTIDFQYPITIVFSDYTTTVIHDENELESYRDDDCNDGSDEDIECVDFEYPVAVSIFNIITEHISDVTIISDYQMFNFIENLSENDTATIRFPFKVILSDGTEITITSLEQLESVIDEAKDDCDEDDDNDFNDDDCNACTTDGLSTLFSHCDDWFVDNFILANGSHIEDNYIGYEFKFKDDNAIEVEGGGNDYTGTWSASGSGNNIILTINISGLSEFNEDWHIHEIIEGSSGSSIDLTLGDAHLKFGSSCD